MKRILPVLASLTLLLTLLLSLGCDKEKIVESTETIKEIEYIQLPADTVYRVDSIFINDSVLVNTTDTVIISDTVVVSDSVVMTDTVIVVDTIVMSDTVIQVDYVYDTVLVHDTVVSIVYQTDTVTITETVIDTVLTVQCDPTEYTAMGALQYHCDPLVMQLITQEFGLTDGWIYYLTSNQLSFTRQSATVYDIYGYIEYWTIDWTGYYPLEFNWRLTFTGTDPSNPTHWTMTDPPIASPGLKIVPRNTEVQLGPH